MTVTFPPLGASMPATTLRRVLLPDPLGPTSATISPVRTARVTSLSAATAPTAP
jgi:hypothetical protein